ncbi:hypothetical protein BDR26DRAFT_257623 [Obelidium mucronatum]|nr:hypothetical protein BDR26DRAFT_257623 [Obelidium mucronatum]
MPVLFHRGFQDTGFIKSHFSLPNTATFTQASPAVLGTIAAIVLVAAAVVIVYRRNLYREMSPVAALSSIQVHSESKAAKPKDASISNLDHEVLRLMNSVLEKQEDKPIGILKITIYEGKGLKNAELVGKSDPYAVVKLGGVSVGRTRAIQNNLNPAWQQTLYIPVVDFTR